MDDKIKVYLFDLMTEMDDTMGIDGIPFSEIVDRLNALAPDYDTDNLDELMDEGMEFAEALEWLEEQAAEGRDIDEDEDFEE